MQQDWAGTYQVWVTLDGCTKEDTVHVQVSPQPGAPVPQPVPTSLCAGTPLHLSVAGPALGHYVWTGPMNFTGQDTLIQQASVGMNGTYQVTVTVNGCTSPIAYFNLNNNVIPLPL